MRLSKKLTERFCCEDLLIFIGRGRGSTPRHEIGFGPTRFLHLFSKMVEVSDPGPPLAICKRTNQIFLTTTSAGGELEDPPTLTVPLPKLTPLQEQQGFISIRECHIRSL